MGQDRDVAQDRVTVQEAARRLGVKEDAIRKRIQRGSIRNQKDPSGRVWVWVRPAQDTAQDADASSQDEAQDPYRDTTQDSAQDGRLEDLREQVAYLRRQLDEEREARRRADTILVQLSAANAEQARTIRAIEAPQEPPEDAETVEEAPEGPETRPATGGVQEATRGAEAGGERRPWWRRVFGG